MRDHHTAYDHYVTARCERDCSHFSATSALGALPCRPERIYLAGGLAPRYLVGRLPAGTRAHVGTTDVDLIIGLADSSYVG